MPTSSSFLSGHAASAVAFTTGAAHEAPAAALSLSVAVAAVAFSRVYTGVHYTGVHHTGDVPAGGVVALGAAALVPPVVPLTASGPSSGATDSADGRP